MKKIILVLVCGTLLFSAGCSKTATVKTSEEIVAVASFYPIYILALNVVEGVEGVSLKKLMQSEGGCAHDYQLTTEDLRSLENAEILLTNGAGMEGFLDDVTKRYQELEVVDTSHGASFVDIGESEKALDSEDLEEANHEHDDSINSHIWLSVPNAVKQVENIRDAFIRIDPKNEQQYRDNAQKFSEKCKELTAEMRGSDLAKRQSVAVFHEGFDYFASDFGFDVEIGLYSDEYESPSAKEVGEAIEEAKEENIKLYFAAPDSGQKLAETISAEAGGEVILLDPITGGADNKDAYIEAMKKNIIMLREAQTK